MAKSFQADIAKYLKFDDKLFPTLAAAGIIGHWSEHECPPNCPVCRKLADMGANPVDAWELRICDDGVIIRGPPSDDTANRTTQKPAYEASFLRVIGWKPVIGLVGAGWKVDWK